MAFTGSGSEAESGNEQSLVARIIADFSDIETEQTHRSHNNNNDMSPKGPICCSPKTYERLIFTPHSSSALPETKQASTASGDAGQSRRRTQRIVTKSYRNGITTLDLQVGFTFIRNI